MTNHFENVFSTGVSEVNENCEHAVCKIFFQKKSPITQFSKKKMEKYFSVLFFFLENYVQITTKITHFTQALVTFSSTTGFFEHEPDKHLTKQNFHSAHRNGMWKWKIGFPRLR